MKNKNKRDRVVDQGAIQIQMINKQYKYKFECQYL